MKPNLEGYSENTLTRIKTHPWTYKSARIVIMRSSKIDNDLSRWDEGTINDFMAVAVETGIIDDDSVSSLHVDSWHLYDGLHPTNNNADYNEERLNQLVAIHRVVEHMEADGRSPFLYRANTTQLESYYLEDHYLRELLLNPEENYSRVDIVDIITTHSVYDAGRIKAMLDSTSPALRSGVI